MIYPKKKNELAELDASLSSLKIELQGKISGNLSAYNKKFALGKFTSFKNILSKKIDNLPIFEPKDVTDEILALSTKFEKVKNFPEDFTDIQLLPKYSVPCELKKIQDKLKSPVSKVKLEGNLEEYINNNIDFITRGISIKKGDICPFCHQEISQNAQKIIISYTNFLQSQENATMNFCKSMEKLLESYVENLGNIANSLERAKETYNLIKGDLINFKVKWHDMNSLSNLINVTIKLLENLRKKYQDVTQEVNIDDEIVQFDNAFAQLDNDIDLNNEEIKKINQKKNDMSSELKKLKEQLIRNIEIELFKNESVLDYVKKKNQREKLSVLIEEKEANTKIHREGKIQQTLKYFLNFFFQDKYTLSDDFIISFDHYDITNDLEHVLSDGEKTIIAFCHYLAETHTLIKNIDDYQRVFFIIDDPISSLDSDYIFSMIQLIRHMNEYFSISHDKYIILTHNIEFMSLLKRNNICSNYLELTDGLFHKIIDNRFNIPYVSHLSDLYKIYNGLSEPCHTTLNSMRQVLEGIRTFMSPSKTLEEFIKGTPELKDTELYSRIQDGSHGDIFLGQTINNLEIKALVKCIIEYIRKSSFTDQLNQL